MMGTAAQTDWQETDNPLIFISKDDTMIEILCGTSMTAKPQVVPIAQWNTVQKRMERTEIC